MKEVEAAWFGRTGVYPMHGTIVVKESVLRDHPFVARALLDAFGKAKAGWLASLRDGTAKAATDEKYRELIPLVGADPLPFGLAANMPAITALESYAFKQQLIPRRMSIGELFVDPEKL